MHTVVLVLGGFVLLGLTWLVARLARRPFAGFAWGFVAVWFVCAAVNMWIGITQAGYSFAAELPIFVVVFAVPAAVAVLMRHRL